MIRSLPAFGNNGTTELNLPLDSGGVWRAKPVRMQTAWIFRITWTLTSSNKQPTTYSSSTFKGMAFVLLSVHAQDASIQSASNHMADDKSNFHLAKGSVAVVVDAESPGEVP